LSARLRPDAALEVHASGEIVVYLDGSAVGLGAFSRSAADSARTLPTGLPIPPLRSRPGSSGRAIDSLLRRLASRGLLEYRLAALRGRADLVVIEPQVADYWPRMPRLREGKSLVLSRFAYMRRRDRHLVLESPRAGALFKICDQRIAAAIASLATPQPVKDLDRRGGLRALLALLFDCRIICQTDERGEASPVPAEGDEKLALWEFHDLLFHARSTAGRHANPLGGIYRHVGRIPPLPPVRPAWPGTRVDLSGPPAALPQPTPPIAKLLRRRHSMRSFDGERPITLGELAWFLDGSARVLARSAASPDLDDGGHAARPYPSAGACYELELYLTVERCDGLARGFYHYDADVHALTAIEVAAPEIEAQLAGAAYAMGAPGRPQILITIAARFGRLSWKYGSIAYSLILKDVGVLIQTLYLMATDMGLGGCAIGISDIDLFERMTRIDFHAEGAVGHFALGRPADPGIAG
jgi:SagB-type dehydrogenase family enzyme